MHISPTALLLSALTLLFANSHRAHAEEDSSLYNTEIYESPWEGEKPSKGEFSVRHAGVGEMPKQGYFKKHEPGETAEFHLFVPKGLDKKQTYPLLIVYHGGKDGASGKGMCRRFAKLSTTKHPVIVLSPNMYTMDAYNELIEEGKVPIDPKRVVIYGHSSGGMGVLSAMKEYLRTKKTFVPAALISSSTTASQGRVDYPPCTYFVMAGQKETPEFVKNKILKNRRRTCRVHSLVMQQVIDETRYVEVQGSGHAGGTPAHIGVIQHAIAVSERAPSPKQMRTSRPELKTLAAAASAGDWIAVQTEVERIEAIAEFGPRGELAKLQRGISTARQRWFKAEIKAIAGISKKSSYADRDRAFLRYDRVQGMIEAVKDESLAAEFKKLEKARHWQAELAARIAYRKIVSGTPSAEMRAPLQALRKEAKDTEYGRNRTREKLLALESIDEQVERQMAPDDEAKTRTIKNPYYPNTTWRVWRDNEEPVENVKTLVHEGKKKVPATITLVPTPVGKRVYPSGELKDGEPIVWKAQSSPSAKFAGVWDDVYASWSGLHGYVRPTYRTTDGSQVHLRPKGLDHIMHFVEVRKTAELLRCGINFVHQSTTGMSHTITNGYNPNMALSYERIYFADLLVTGPAHASYTEQWADRTNDLIMAHMPTFFNSVGSSNSETIAITKMMIAGAYLPPESKVTLKREGLYPSALLYMWKASMPFDVPYGHELKHRVAYRAFGDEAQHVGRYGHAGNERGNLSLAYHRYDEIAHMRNMIAMAQTMTVLPPEALMDDLKVEGGTSTYLMKKTALILQEPGKDVTVRVSTTKSYDLADRPLTMRWKLLYGNHAVSCVPGAEPGSWIIRVPWDETLPEGRTAIALIANNGVHDGNPAIITVYRKRGELPPNGAGYGGYKYNSPHANRRPVIFALQDQIVKAGQIVRLTLNAVDPEGQPVRFFKRAGEPGELVGNEYTLKVPRGRGAKELSVTFIASDGTAGNSYAAKRVQFVVAPKVHAHIESKKLIGAAPFTVHVSAKGSIPKRGKVKWGWEFYEPTPKFKSTAWDKMEHGSTAKHTFKKPGLYEIALTVKSGKEVDRETVHVWVTKGAPPKPVSGVVIEGSAVRIASGDDSPCVFDQTQFGTVEDGKRLRHQFEIFNRGKTKLSISSKAMVIEGTHAAEFRIAKRPAKRVSPGGSAVFEIEFRPKGTGPRTAEVVLNTGTKTIRFSIAGEGK